LPVTADIQTFIPTVLTIPLNNPFMGWSPFANFGPYPQPHTMVLAETTWREIEGVKGVYDFAGFEARNKFDYWTSLGVKINLRIVLDNPGDVSHLDIPDWLYDETHGDGTMYDIPWGKGFSPDYDNPIIIEEHAKLIAKFAERYNNDSRIAFIEVGSVGHWGEWHTYAEEPDKAIPFPKVSTTDKYVKPYIDGFTNKICMMRRPYQMAKDAAMGLFNDSFGDTTQTVNYFLQWINNGYNWWLTGEHHPAMPDFWKSAPSGGELADSPGLQYFTDQNIGQTIQQAQDSHLSWIGPCSPARADLNTNIQKNIDLLLKTIGYRFVIQQTAAPSEAAAGSDMSISMTWVNQGLAPFYYKWPVELSLSDSQGNIVAKFIQNDDIRKWLPGVRNIDTAISIPAGLKSGTYTLCAAILDPDTGNPEVDLAIAGKRADGRYAINQIQVTSNTAFAAIVTQ